MKDKIRLRSDEELLAQNIGLQEVKRIFEELGISYFLSSGTLLGAVREKNFIRWDWDVQCYILTEESYPRREEIYKCFHEKGFEPLQYIKSYKNLKYNFIKYGTNYEITAWWQKDDMRYRSKYSQLPASFFENTQAIDFLGESYPCMTPPNLYLEYCYGDWKVPKREADKNKYLSPRFYKYPLWYRKIMNIIRRPVDFIKRLNQISL